MSQIMIFKILFLITLSHLLLQTSARKCFLTNEYTVHVVTFLPEDSPPLEFHCASGDDDLGNHKLTKYGTEVKWSFCDNITHTTLFFCTLHWGKKKKSLDVFKSSWRNKCSSGNCVWAAQEDGIYFANKPPVYNKAFDWEN
ncbi:S-protein homolog 24-like [Salvia hispanica]|uniref:S-protein homolog 24-like n=1 Tax=Salvia hispanica TaxID=49212 RepID=UPI002009B009|nr:S-protein homolog 24-like [Salvia hispanica]